MPKLNDKYRSMILATVAILALYFIMVLVKQGWPTYLVSVPAFLIIGLTCLARINAIKPENKGLNWDVRRVGLCLCAGVMVMFIAGPIYGVFPTGRVVILAWGVSMVWTTTPGMPPFWPWAARDPASDTSWSLKAFVDSLLGRS